MTGMSYIDNAHIFVIQCKRRLTLCLDVSMYKITCDDVNGEFNDYMYTNNAVNACSMFPPETLFSPFLLLRLLFLLLRFLSYLNRS